MDNLDKFARSIRRQVIQMAIKSKSAHVGSALSCVEILTALYFSIMKFDPLRLDYQSDDINNNRDRLIFSKGHGCMALYVALAEVGAGSSASLWEYGENGSILPGHATKGCFPGVEATTGSLGHGLPMAVGMALAAKRDGKEFRVFAVLSDGECQEGSTWEAALMAAHHKLDNLVVIVDHNKIQGFGRVSEVMNLEPFVDKWKAFNWEAAEVNGHSVADIISCFNCRSVSSNKPKVIIAHTIKGKGLASSENSVASHYLPPTPEDLDLFMKGVNE